MATKNGKMLKDFLQDSNTNVNINNNNNNNNNEVAGSMEPANSLRRSRSWSRSRAALTSFQKLLKSFHHQNNSSSAVTPSTLQRSVSKRLLERLRSKTPKRSESGEVRSSKIMVVTVRVKDILRWKSFRVVEEEVKFNHCQPLDEVVGPANDAGSSSSNDGLSEMSWGESEFTAVEEVEEEEELSCCVGEFGGEEGKIWDDVVDEDGGASDSEVGPKQDKHNSIGSEEGTEQQSPISVLNSPFRDEVSEEELPLSFDQKMANMERTKQRLLQSIQWFEDLAGVHDDEDEQPHEENESIEAKTTKAYSNRGFSWFKQGNEGLLEKKECIEKLGKWNKFEEERTELGVELEDEVLSDLLDEVISDFCE